MTNAEKDNYWMTLIQQCRASGMSDYAWCNQNRISLSSFYYNIRRLRTKACIPDPVAICLEYNGIIMAISDDSDAAIIKATLMALQQLC